MSYLDDLGYSQEEQRLGRALERVQDEKNNLQARCNELTMQRDRLLDALAEGVMTCVSGDIPRVTIGFSNLADAQALHRALMDVLCTPQPKP